MTNIETTALKLKTTPTGGRDAAHSPYYRRLLSAGYKGQLQGAIGGGSLYGTMGLVIGGLVAIPLFFMSGLPVAAPFLLMGLTAGTGALVGATTFGSIGSTAAINAESADLSEQRRYLLDRYNDLPEGPEADREAAEIRKQLVNLQNDTVNHPPFFHWKTVAICAAAGALLAFAAFATPLGAALIAHGGILAGAHAAIDGALGSALATGTVGTAIGAAVGALTGAVIGIDRYYIRKWFDKTEGIVHSSSHTESALAARSDMVSRLQKAAKQDEVVKGNMLQQQAALSTGSAPQLSTTEATAAKPDNKISEATAHDRIEKLQRALDVAL